LASLFQPSGKGFRYLVVKEKPDFSGSFLLGSLDRILFIPPAARINSSFDSHREIAKTVCFAAVFLFASAYRSKLRLRPQIKNPAFAGFLLLSVDRTGEKSNFCEQLNSVSIEN
jgi:hypothetical protein